MKCIFKSSVIFVSLCVFSFTAQCTETPLDANSTLSTSSSAFKHIAEDKELLHEYLDKVKGAELHFFWTTGRTLSDNPEYQPNTKVDIGGAKYGSKFFPYVEKLLESSPNNLKIKFVCDTMTVKSNESQITALRHTYGNRFEILPIDKIQENLLKTFPQDTKQINILFKNATQGNPVIASDIYRLICMPYDLDLSSDIVQTQYSYCDVDEFCYGMETSGSHHNDFIKALFNPIIQTPFYFGRIPTNNDLMKLRITDIESYKNFCHKILCKLNINAPVLSYFSNLHEGIKKCEQNPQPCSDVASFISSPIQNLVGAITRTTGPKFLDSISNITTDLSYLDITAGEWASPEEVLDHRLPKYGSTHPTSVLDWGYANSTPEEEKAGQLFDEECGIYRKILAAAFYAKRFGNHHPFNVAIRNYLVNQYPYHSTSFKELLKVNFEIRCKNIPQQYKLALMSDFSENEIPEEGYLYLENEGDKLKFAVASPAGIFEQGTFAINIEGSLTRRSMNKFRSEILEEAAKKGLTREPKKGLTYEEWTTEAFNRIIGNPYNHYHVLTNLLKQLGIEISFTHNDMMKLLGDAGVY